VRRGCGIEAANGTDDDIAVRWGANVVVVAVGSDDDNDDDDDADDDDDDDEDEKDKFEGVGAGAVDCIDERKPGEDDNDVALW
jgi:hypothetical protein